MIFVALHIPLILGVKVLHTYLELASENSNYSTVHITDIFDTYVCTYIHVHLRMRVCMYVCVYVCVCMHDQVHSCIPSSVGNKDSKSSPFVIPPHTIGDTIVTPLDKNPTYSTFKDAIESSVILHCNALYM